MFSDSLFIGLGIVPLLLLPPAEAQRRGKKAQAEAPEAQKSTASWEVAESLGEGREATIDVSEGTWMSVDVSPAGDQLVFDLLGDLYLLPIEGGQATPLTSGV
ncbi:MAG: hypothetical protein AAGA81_15160, partial [Acidobacteriota bacterium]